MIGTHKNDTLIKFVLLNEYAPQCDEAYKFVAQN